MIIGKVKCECNINILDSAYPTMPRTATTEEEKEDVAQISTADEAPLWAAVYSKNKTPLLMITKEETLETNYSSTSI